MGYQSMHGKFFGHMMKSHYQIRAYYKKYGDIGVSREVIDEIDNWYDNL
jgi:hypothetical protein